MREKRGSLLYQRVRPFGQKWEMIKWIECHGRPWKLSERKELREKFPDRPPGHKWEMIK